MISLPCITEKLVENFYGIFSSFGSILGEKIKPLVAVYYADDDDDCAERPAVEIQCCYSGQFSC